MKNLFLTALSVLLCIAAAHAGDDQSDQATALKALGLSAGMTAGQGVEAISWRDLAKLLPKEIEGLEAGKIDGGTFKMDGSNMNADQSAAVGNIPGLTGGYSMVERDYVEKKEGEVGRKISIRVMDSGMLTAMLATFNMAVEYDTPDGLMKSTEIKGYPAKMTQEFDDDLEVKSTQYMVLVSERILVHFEGNQKVDSDEVKSLAEDFPYGELESMSAMRGGE